MKVILTEEQLHKVLLSEETERILIESLNEENSGSGLKTKIKKAIMAGVSIAIIFSAISKLSVSQSTKEKLKEFAEYIERQNDSIRQDSVLQMKADSIFNKKVEACKNYMEYALKNQGYTLESTGLKPEELVKACDENNFSLPFVMAVGNLESCFGATPRAKRTNSVFSVGSYDNGKNVCTYSDPNESIVSFINLLKKDYLTDNKTLDDILSPGNFVNMNGDRYAKNKKYEGQVKNIMNRIVKMYPILNT